MHGQPEPLRTGPYADDAAERPVVLVVEDNPMVQKLLEASFAGGCRVVLAGDGVEGLERAAAEPPDLIITDVVMPRMKGPELIGRLREHERLSEVPIMVLTGQDDESMRVRLLAGKVQDYVHKPFVVEEV